MAKKLKFKKSKGIYRLNLTHAEAELIAALVYQIRLGRNDVYEYAAYDLVNEFDKHPDFTSGMEGYVSINSSVDSEGYTVIEVQESPNL